MDEIIYFLEMDLPGTLVAVLISLAAIRAATEVFEWFSTKYGIQTKGMREKSEGKERIAEALKRIGDLEEARRAEAGRFGNTERQLYNEIESLKATIDKIDSRLEEVLNRHDRIEQMKLKDEIVEFYNKFAPLGEWPGIAKKVFWDIFLMYESHGLQDDFVKGVVEPAMRKLKINEDIV